jgi:hypothetical protein
MSEDSRNLSWCHRREAFGDGSQRLLFRHLPIPKQIGLFVGEVLDIFPFGSGDLGALEDRAPESLAGPPTDDVTEHQHASSYGPNGTPFCRRPRVTVPDERPCR